MSCAVDDGSNDATVLASAVEFIRRAAGDVKPRVMIVTGSGLAAAAAGVEIRTALPYDRIPGMTSPEVVGHPGRALFGVWGGREVVVFQGRTHLYEGKGWAPVVYPVRLAAALAVKIALITNSSGAINPTLEPGSLVVIDDHLNFTGSNPPAELFNPATFPRSIEGSQDSSPLVDLSEAYCRELRERLLNVGAEVGLALARGVYLSVIGPSYETPAEIRAFRTLGADVVGMSTVGEVLTARRLGLRCVAISCVSNWAAGVTDRQISHQEVIDAGRAVAGRLALLIESFLKSLD
jgi:purine-nucleoside phosphorylase